MEAMVIDGKGLVVGRLAAFAAKQALNGRKVDIVDIEQAVISGNAQRIVGIYRSRRLMKNYANPEKSPKWPRRPDFLFKRILEGMLPATRRGKEAGSRVKAHIGTPSGLVKATHLNLKSSRELNKSYVSLAKISADLGWHKN